MNEQVKVGQVWRTFEGHMLEIEAFTSVNDLRVRNLHTDSVYACSQFQPEGWTLVQDVPEEAPGFTLPVAPVGIAYTLKVPGLEASYFDSYSHEQLCQNASLKLPKIDMSAGSVEGACTHCEQGDPCDECRDAWFDADEAPIDPCAALRASLPTSGKYVETRECGDERNVGMTAKADLRRKLGTLRSWPLCPASGEALTVRAEVKTDHQYGTRKGWQHSRIETINIWTARTCCAGCEGSK